MARTFKPGFAVKAPHLIALTGTPVLNRPAEIFPLLRAVRPDEYQNFFAFAKRYCDAHPGSFGWDFSGCSNVEELRGKLQDVMVRREKANVLKDLPAKRRVTIEVELSNAKDYRAAARRERDNLEDAFDKRDAGAALVVLNRLRRMAGWGKVEAAQEWVENFLLGGGQLIVFAHHKDVLDALRGELAKASVPTVRVDGDVPVKERQAAVDAFQAGQARVFLGTPGAAGVGLTLTAASDVLFVEREWTPAVEEQAEDRAHRIGQEESVTAWYLTASDSIDAKFAQLVEKKRAVIGAVLDGRRVEDADASLMWDLVDSLTKEDQVGFQKDRRESFGD